MGFLVVTDQSDLEAVANSVLRTRLSKTARAAALDGIRAANPGLDFSRLKPGAVIRIPTTDGLKSTGKTDGLDTRLDDLRSMTNDALERLSADSTAANQANDQERNATLTLLKSDAVAGLAGHLPALKESIDSVLKTLEEDSKEERQQVKDLIDSVDVWTRQLEKLSAL